jgi:D-serine deaminase-like pyridoxal phosphate-dependent protein
MAVPSDMSAILAATSKPRTRSKLPPRVTHWILIQPWQVYIADADTIGTAIDTPIADGWMPVVAKSEEHARAIGAALLRRLKGAKK